MGRIRLDETTAKTAWKPSKRRKSENSPRESCGQTSKGEAETMTTAAEKVVVPEKREGNAPANPDRTATAHPQSGTTGGAVAKPAAEKPLVATPAPEKRRALGRGLESLLPGGPRIVGGATTPASSAPQGPGMPSVSARSLTVPPSYIASPQVSASAATAQAPATNPVASAAAAVAPPTESAPVSAVDLQAVTLDPALDEEKLGDLSAAAASKRGERMVQIEPAAILPNPYQTRLLFSEDELRELADSIKANGILQPILVRPADEEGKYKLIVGERRLRAAQMVGMETIPAIIRRVNDETAAELTVIENLQRDDLRCMEQAEAFAMLSREFKLTQEEIGKKVGVSRETVSNYMRLMKLPFEIRQYLRDGQLDFSHARELLNLRDTSLLVKIADEAVKKHMSVLQLEALIMDTNMPLERQGDPVRRGARWVDPNVKEAQRQLQEKLGLKVKIRDRRGKGKITIEYASIEDFDRVVEMLAGGE
jgi:ParB family chromosome partitioning protein